MKVKNLKVNNKKLAVLLASAITLSSLTGCGLNPYYKDKDDRLTAVIFGDNTATIIEIERPSQNDYLVLKDGKKIWTDERDVKVLVNMTDEEIVEFAKDIMGEDVVINYYEPEQEAKVKSK